VEIDAIVHGADARGEGAEAWVSGEAREEMQEMATVESVRIALGSSSIPPATPEAPPGSRTATPTDESRPTTVYRREARGDRPPPSGPPRPPAGSGSEPESVRERLPTTPYPRGPRRGRETLRVDSIKRKP
jgi:hypothetical protein